MINIITVKIGEKYASTYVNRLFDMCSKHLSYQFLFTCYTDDPTDLNPNITVIPFVDNNLKPIVHNKLYLFSKEFERKLDSSLPRVFFDLDIVIRDNIDQIVTYAYSTNESFAVINASWKQYSQSELQADINIHTINSSCMIWKPYANMDIWNHYFENKERFQKTYDKGMDAYLVYEHDLKGKLPEDLFRSYLFGIPRKYSRLPKTYEHYRSIEKRFPIILFNGPTTEEDVHTFIESGFTSSFFDLSLLFSDDEQTKKTVMKEAEAKLLQRMIS